MELAAVLLKYKRTSELKTLISCFLLIEISDIYN